MNRRRVPIRKGSAEARRVLEEERESLKQFLAAPSNNSPLRQFDLNCALIRNAYLLAIVAGEATGEEEVSSLVLGQQLALAREVERIGSRH